MNEYRNNYLGFNISLKEHFEDINILGKSIKGYTGKYTVFDDFDFWQIDNRFESKEECHFYKWCAKDEIREGSKIQFEDGKEGVILGKEFADTCLKYSPIKKDGTVGKSKRNLYGNLKYKVIKY